MDLIDEFINWAKNNNWNITIENNYVNNISDNNNIKKYNVPNEYIKFLENIKICINEEEKKWFLCLNDYLENSKSSFIWDEYKDLLLQYPWNEKYEVENYFNKIFPIIFNVSSEYNNIGNFKYYGINTETYEIIVGNGIGQGEQIDDIKIISNNFETFLDKIINGEIEI
jgi:hypothetical protein